MSQILPDKSGVEGHIYLIEKIGKKPKYYVGQTLSHRKNRGKYRPFGYEGRFNDHVSEAMCNTKKKQCWYLNNAIRRYGKDAFKVSLLQTCALTELDTLEQHYIEKYKSLYPSGYNLTSGGKVFKSQEIPNSTLQTKTPGKRGGCKERSNTTRQKMSTSLKEAFKSVDVRTALMQRTQNQHYQQKLDKFRDVEVDAMNLTQYIYTRNSTNNGQFVRIKVDNKAVDFVGKYETIETLQKRALTFLEQIAGNASKLTGNP